MGDWDNIHKGSHRSIYVPRPRKEVSMEEGGEIGSGLAMDTSQTTSIGTKSYVSIAKKEPLKK